MDTLYHFKNDFQLRLLLRINLFFVSRQCLQISYAEFIHIPRMFAFCGVSPAIETT